MLFWMLGIDIYSLVLNLTEKNLITLFINETQEIYMSTYLFFYKWEQKYNIIVLRYLYN